MAEPMVRELKFSETTAPLRPAPDNPQSTTAGEDGAVGTAFSRRLVAPIAKYLEGRSLLLSLETREAAQQGATLFLWLSVGGLAAFAGWLLLTTSVVGLLTIYPGWSWVVAAAVVGGAHLLIALFAGLMIRRCLTTARWFPDSLNELKKDHTWLRGQTIKN